PTSAEEVSADTALDGIEEPIRLNDRRMASVVEALLESGARSVLDLGCGSGRLIQALLKERQFERIVGVDAATRELEMAASRLNLERLPARQPERVTLLPRAVAYPDRRRG